MSTIETDYLVVGAGATGMSFTDALIAHSDAEVILVDRRHRPGGHWNDGYGFLRLHQPSSYYGVNSRPLGNDRIDEWGPNAGFYERATSAEVSDYYGRVLDEGFLPSNRVRFLGLTDYVGKGSGGHEVVSRLTGRATTITVRRRLVDATLLQATLPNNHTPPFTIDPDVRFMPPHSLANAAEPGGGFTIVGAGKTAMDTCCWLIDQGVPPDEIRWIRPRDAWTVDRAQTQTLKLMGSMCAFLAMQTEAAARATDAHDFMLRLEEGGGFARLDGAVTAEVFRGPTTSESERATLRSISNVVRLGKVKHIGTSSIQMERGSIPTTTREVHVDCTAPGVSFPRGDRPIFEPGRISLQRMVWGIDMFGAAITGLVEATRDDDRERNRLCPPNVGTDRAADYAAYFLQSQRTRMGWFNEPDLRDFLAASRLTPLRGAAEYLTDPEAQAALGRYITLTQPSIENLERVLNASAR